MTDKIEKVARFLETVMPANSRWMGMPGSQQEAQLRTDLKAAFEYAGITPHGLLKACTYCEGRGTYRRWRGQTEFSVMHCDYCRGTGKEI